MKYTIFKSGPMTHPDCRWHVDEDGLFHSAHATWADAMRAVDEAQRTITVTIPRIPGHAPIETADGDGYWEPREEGLWCTCGECLWSWMQGEDYTDSRIAWIAHLGEERRRNDNQR